MLKKRQNAIIIDITIHQCCFKWTFHWWWVSLFSHHIYNQGPKVFPWRQYSHKVQFKSLNL